jgi:hypothetical protein
MIKVKDGPIQAREVLPSAQARQETPSGIGPTARQQLGTALRAMYDDLAQQPLPDRFVELLDQLDTASHKKRP